MAKISRYQFDEVVNPSDFVIGTDNATNFTRNYKLEDLAKFFGKQQSLLGDKFAYTYNQFAEYPDLLKTEMSFSNKSEVNTTFTGVTKLYYNPINDVEENITSFFQSIQTNGVLRLHNSARTTDYGIYRVQSITPIQNNVLEIVVDLLIGNGTVQDGDTIVNSATFYSDVHYKTPEITGTVWEIEHLMGKFPSVTVVDTSNNIIYSEVQYIDLNNVTITFSSEVTGFAYLN